jgi:hypothetical protein
MGTHGQFSHHRGFLNRSHRGNLLDVVHQTEQLPLRVHFLLAAQSKSIHPLVLEIPEHRLYDGNALVVNEPAKQGVELPFHPLDRAVLGLLRTTNEDRHLFGLGSLRRL